MPKSVPTIALRAIGLPLSIALAACAHLPTERAPTAVAVKVDTPPPADLLACPQPVEGFPEDAVAIMPPAVRFAAIRIVTAYAAASAQLSRLIEWHAPASCKAR